MTWCGVTAAKYKKWGLHLTVAKFYAVRTDRQTLGPIAITISVFAQYDKLAWRCGGDVFELCVE